MNINEKPIKIVKITSLRASKNKVIFKEMDGEEIALAVLIIVKNDFNTDLEGIYRETSSLQLRPKTLYFNKKHGEFYIKFKGKNTYFSKEDWDNMLQENERYAWFINDYKNKIKGE